MPRTRRESEQSKLCNLDILRRDIGADNSGVRSVQLDSRHTEDIKTTVNPVSADVQTIGDAIARGVPSNDAGLIRQANQSKFMATIGSMIGNASKSATNPCERVRTATGSLSTPRDRLRGGKSSLFVYAGLLAAGICAAAAQEVRVARPSGLLEFHIPSQPLAAALQAYGQRAGVQVLYESTSAIGRMSVTVDGDFVPEAALDMLIAGSDLKVRYVRPDVITLAPAIEERAGPPPLSGPLGGADLSLGTLHVRDTRESDETARLNEYSERVRMDIQNALRKNAKTRDGSYRAVLDLWIDPARTIARTELFRSSGDAERDTAITTTLRGVTISRPAPANVPQPVRVGIVVKSLQ